MYALILKGMRSLQPGMSLSVGLLLYRTDRWMSGIDDGRKTVFQRALDAVERVGNAVPHPAVLFAGLIVLVAALSMSLTSNYYFGVGSSVLLIAVCTFVTDWIVESRLGKYAGDPADASLPSDVAPQVESENRGLLYAGVGTIAAPMLPSAAATGIAWVAAFFAWRLLGIPFGPSG